MRNPGGIANDVSKLENIINILLPTNYIPSLSSYDGKQSPKKRDHGNPDYHPRAKKYKRPLYICRKPSLEDAYLQPSNNLLPLQKKYSTTWLGISTFMTFLQQIYHLIQLVIGISCTTNSSPAIVLV